MGLNACTLESLGGPCVPFGVVFRIPFANMCCVPVTLASLFMSITDPTTIDTRILHHW